MKIVDGSFRVLEALYSGQEHNYDAAYDNKFVVISTEGRHRSRRECPYVELTKPRANGRYTGEHTDRKWIEDVIVSTKDIQGASSASASR